MSAPEAVVSGVGPGTRRMWAGGPLRRLSPIRSAGCQIPLEGGGYGGSYVCDECLMPVVGVYRVIQGVQGRETWLCAACKDAARRTRKKKGRSCS
jgi:hypothetical protein